MCGINGFDWVDRKSIKSMNNTLKHRGPDGEGTYFGKKVSLGHRRLAVIDLSAKAKQPMSYSHKRKKAVIIHNGEIYNFLGLRKELEKKDYKFKSNSDTEVILASYFEWGFDCVKKFNGMWAFCIYDIKNKKLFLSRDRAGKKPLYYFYDKKKFIFSSEIKGILKHKIKPKINKEAIDFYLSMGFIPSPYSIYKNIYKLEARQNIIYDLKKNSLEKMYYYKIQKHNPLYNKEKFIKQTDNILNDSIKFRLISDVPLGAFLSGGLDSSAIVAKMADFVNLKNLHTFSIGFKEGRDETSYSDIMKNLLGTKHHHKYFKKVDFESLLKNIYYYFDEPFFDHSMFPSIPLSEIAKKHITVSLSGDGGDEVFGGYPRYNIAAKIEILKKIPKIIRKILFELIPDTKKLNQFKEGIRLSLFNKEDFYAEARSYVYKPESYKRLMRKKLRYFLNLTKGNLVEAVIMMDLYFYTIPDHFLTKTDRTAMSKSLEVRCPFLDYRFLELASRIPTKWKISSSKTKIFMREMLEKYLPVKITERKKEGFMPPIVEWINSHHKKEIHIALAELSKKRLLNEKWRVFYESILNKEDNVSKNFKTRLFLLYKWYENWKDLLGKDHTNLARHS
jgi:asparagine synthase (glutamine-hydrolysing)